MSVEFRLPELSDQTDEGVVVAWFKKEGSPVTKGERLLEVQMEKVSFEVVSPITGTVSRILAPRDTVVKNGDLLALLVESGEGISESEAPLETGLGEKKTGGKRVVLAAPKARLLAKEFGVDLAKVEGSGKDGRITEEDVRKYISGPAAAPSETVVKMSPIRQVTARKMMESIHDSAQLTLHTRADATALVAAREGLKPRLEVSFTDLLIKAVAEVLKEYPDLNSYMEGTEIHLVKSIHIGVAVSLESGLVVPVVRDAGRKSLAEISVETRRLVERARAGKLTEEDLSGGTFTITNLGMYGIDYFTPILLPPQTAMLGVGQIREEPGREQEHVVWRFVMPLSLTLDHRVVDGAPAAVFLRALSAKLGSSDWVRNTA